MITTRARLGWLLSLVVAACGIGVAPYMPQDRETSPRPPAEDGHTRSPVAGWPSIEAAVSAHAFRIGRAPPGRPYSILAVEPTSSPPQGGERPPWRLSGVLEAPVAVALFEGVGGGRGAIRLAAVGDTIGSYRIDAIRGDTVIVVGDRERWSYTLEAPWRR
jgi:hypothetical protein